MESDAIEDEEIESLHSIYELLENEFLDRSIDNLTRPINERRNYDDFFARLVLAEKAYLEAISRRDGMIRTVIDS